MSREKGRGRGRDRLPRELGARRGAGPQDPGSGPELKAEASPSEPPGAPSSVIIKDIGNVVQKQLL